MFNRFVEKHTDSKQVSFYNLLSHRMNVKLRQLNTHRVTINLRVVFDPSDDIPIGPDRGANFHRGRGRGRGPENI